jgi:hypothetical protein
MEHLKKIAKRSIQGIMSFLSLLLSPVFAIVARRGWGAEQCLKFGFLPLPVHYYSPVPDIQKLKQKNVWVVPENPQIFGVPVDLDEQFALVQALGNQYGAECLWPEQAASGYYAQNPTFGYSSACILHTWIRHFKPARVIEVGSGYSSIITTAALEMNNRETGCQVDFTAIEPFPRRSLLANLPGLTQLIQKPVEDVPLTFFSSLQAGDLLFLDSSHVVRIGGDINFLYLHVLPSLAPGVMVHIHDIHLPYEYPQSYYLGEHKYFWTEQYLLHAFLQHNEAYKVLLCAYWLQKDHPQEFARAFPHYDVNRYRPSSSFYLQRVR